MSPPQAGASHYRGAPFGGSQGYRAGPSGGHYASSTQFWTGYENTGMHGSHCPKPEKSIVVAGRFDLSEARNRKGEEGWYFVGLEKSGFDYKITFEKDPFVSKASFVCSPFGVEDLIKSKNKAGWHCIEQKKFMTFDRLLTFQHEHR